jgi:ATP-dependent exoDNAse (exonuclease V) alpha subunit
MSDIDILGPEQQEALDAAMAGRSCFLTGPAGGGKSFVTKKIVQALRAQRKVVAVTGSTGIAAVNIGGNTIHSLLGTGTYSRADQVKANLSGDRVGKCQDRVGAVDVIVIDEVSMLSGDFINMMDWWLNLVRGCSTHVPFGGAQIIFVGDCLQLPPVQKASERIDCKYCFQAKAWTDADPYIALLLHNYRQSDDSEMRRHLLRTRRGQCPDDTAEFFNTRVGAKLRGRRATRVYPLNRDVDRVNREHLESLPGDVWSAEAAYSGHEGFVEKLKANMSCMDPLELKVGAEVVFLKNDREKRYVNGTRGVVSVLHPEGGVIVTDRAGNAISVERDSWSLRDAHDAELACVEQFPLKLAAALSVHKCQGMTLDDMEFDPQSSFERGMVYCALSRVRSMEGLSLVSPLRASYVRASKAVVDWYRAVREAKKDAA